MTYIEIKNSYNKALAQCKQKNFKGPVKVEGFILDKKVENNKVLDTADVAHFCKKLEKCGLVSSYCSANSSEKRIVLAKKERMMKK